MASKTNGDRLQAFVDAVKEARDAEGFEILMTPGAVRTLDQNFDPIQESIDCVAIRLSLHHDEGELSALERLKRDRAIERLSSRYPEVWEAVQVAA